MASEQPRSSSFAFIFPMASGHLNPSLPLARALVELGHDVHYLSREQMRGAIEDTGAVFHNDVEVLTEHYEGREPGFCGAFDSLKKEHGLEDDPMFLSWTKLKYVALEQMVPGVLRWLRQLQPKVVLYCPMMNQEAPLGARILGIPSISLITTAGPGSMPKLLQEFMTMQKLELKDMEEGLRTFAPQHEAVSRLNETYNLELELGSELKPFGKLEVMTWSCTNLVTTSEDLQDSCEPELEAYYAAKGASFAAVGALLDKEGAVRAAGHKYASEGEGGEAAKKDHEEAEGKDAAAEVVAKVRAARAAGRRVVLASMGTVITGDSPDLGWSVKIVTQEGARSGLTGRELCQAAWAGVFDAFGAETSEEGPLLVVSLGPQPAPLGDLRAPPNAVCLPVVPQVDLLQAGVDLFLTHGGQNSFTEALTSSVPVVVCPGFGDQLVNAQKAVDLGVGLKVDRPFPAAGQEPAAIAAYRSEVSAKLRRVAAEPSFLEAAKFRAERLRQSGGVPRAVGLILEAAGLAGEALGSKEAACQELGTESPRRQALFAGA